MVRNLRGEIEKREEKENGGWHWDWDWFSELGFGEREENFSEAILNPMFWIQCFGCFELKNKSEEAERGEKREEEESWV